MNTEQFKEFACASIDYIADYCENIRKFPVLPKVEPGYLSHELPKHPPVKGEPWNELINDIDKTIVPGLTHWHSPYFHAFFPTGQSYAAVVGEILMAGIGATASNWESSPAIIELEVCVMDWLAKILGLPKYFLHSSEGPGGGVIQNSASDSTLVGLLSGKTRKINELKSNTLQECEIGGRLVAYASKESNSSIEKSGLIASVKMRLLATDQQGSLRGDVLEEAIRQDKLSGLIPCCVIATLGTTGICSFDNIEEIGRICEREKLWLHIDAAYAGTALSCPEYRYLINGIEYVDSFNFNAHKWMLVNGDCSLLWFKDTQFVEKTFKLIKHQEPSRFEPQLENWQIPDRRRFRALKLWFVIRIYGVEGIQAHVRHQIQLAKHFENLVKQDERFEVITSNLGVVCFKLHRGAILTQKILEQIAERGHIYIMPYYYQEQLLFRFVICSRFTKIEDVEFSWNEISRQTSEIIRMNDEE